MQLQAQKILPQSNPPQLVNDFAGVLSAEQKQILEAKLVALDNNSSNQIAIISVKSLNNEVIEEVAEATFSSWKIGNKKINNGILIIFSLQEKKIWIEIGYGLEGAITDVFTKDIINTYIKPNFKTGNYYRGLDLAIDNLSKAAVGEYNVKRTKSSKKDGNSWIIFVVILFIVILIVGGGRGGGGRNRRSSGLDLLTPLLFSGSGFGGGGSFGGGSNDSGGFGGFGGGDSGGGGAGGDW